MTPFHDLHDYMALPRLTGLRLAPDGSWLAASVSALSADGRTFKPSIWRIPAGPGQPRPRPARLTRSAEGEDNPAFLPDGSLVFLSARPAPPDGPAGEPGSSAPSSGQLAAPPPNAAPGTAGPEAGAVAAPGGRRGGVPAHRAARRHPGWPPQRRHRGPRSPPGAAGGQRHRRRRAAAEEPGGRRGERDPARGGPGPVLGPRPGPGPAPAAAPPRGRRCRRTGRGPLAGRAEGPDQRAGPGAGRASTSS